MKLLFNALIVIASTWGLTWFWRRHINGCWDRDASWEQDSCNRRMRQALGVEYVEAQPNAVLVIEEEPPNEMPDEPAACPSCGTRFNLHDPDCGYIRELNSL